VELCENPPQIFYVKEQNDVIYSRPWRKVFDFRRSWGHDVWWVG
jgi:hypothetical protein